MRKLKLLLVLCMVAIAASASKTVYLVPGAWDVAADTERYALYMFNSDTDNAWVSFTEGTGGIWSAQFDETYSKMIICRMDGASTENNWTNKWNESANLDAPAVDRMYYVNKSPTCGNSPWLSIINPSPNPGDDMTGAIANSNITGSGDCWTVITGKYYGGNGFDGSASFFEIANWGANSWDASASQTITHLPNGYYKLRAAGQTANSDKMWMKLVANGKESYFSRNGDTNGNILANGTETNIGDGVAGWRYTSVIAKVTDGTLTISAQSHADAEHLWANVDAFTLTYLGAEIAPNTDVTNFINNWDFWGCFNDNFNGWKIEKTGGNSWVHGNSAVEHWSNDLSRNFDFYQNISDLPEGRYEISASMWNTQGDGPNGNSGVYGTSNNVTAFAGVTDNCDDTHLHIYSTSLFVNNGEMRLGVKNNGNRSAYWFGVDWIKLNYLGKVVQDYAVELPSDGSMAADTWYYFDITAAANNYKATATNLANIICVDDENALTSATTGTITLKAEDNSFSVGRYYVKSTSANKLELSVASYSYSLGTPATNIKNGDYIGGLTTFTVAFNDAQTNDPDASIVLLNSTAKAVLAKAGTTVAEGTLSLSEKTLTATFSGVTLDVNSEYTLLLAADVIGYAGQASNEAINYTVHTGAIADGVYYFKKKGEFKYLTRGGNYGTETVVDNYGISFEAAIQADGTYYMKNVDHSLSANTNKYLNSYTDGPAYGWNVVAATDGIYLKDADGKYLTTTAYEYEDGNGNKNTYNYQSRTENVADAIVWELLSKTQYATSLEAKKNAEIAAVANAAGINATTLSELETALSTDFGTVDMTSEIKNPLCNSASDWVAVAYNGGSKYESIDYHAPTIQIYNRPGGITQTISGLANGLYKVTVSATWRPGNSQAATRAGNEANTTAWIYANDNITQMKGWYEGGGTINSTQDLIDNADSYLNAVYAYVSDGNLKIGVAVPSFCEQNWCPIYNWTLTRYDVKATDIEKKALADAIADAETKTLGFETGEYAPYNNVAALEALATAKAIVPDASSSETVTAATAALTGATWTANTGEVNAFGDPTFAKSGNDGAQLGWATDHSAGLGGAVHARAFVLVSSDGNYANLAAFGQGDGTRSAGYFRFDGTNSAKTTTYTYGSTAGYTMPLKAATYLMSAQLGGWGQVDKDVVLQIVNESNEVVGSQTVHTPSTGVHAGGSVVNVKFEFEAVAGNYKLLLKNGSTDADNAIVISNLELMKAPVYAVVGCKQGDDNDKAIFSDAWDTATTADILTLINGVYTKTYTNLTLDKQTIDFKVVKQGAEVTWYPAGTGNNHSINIPVNGVYNITFTFDGNDVTAEAIQTAESFTIAAAGWATAVTYNAVDFTGNEKIKAYLATVSGNQVTLTEATKVPAGTPLVLKGETAAVSVIESAEAVTNDLQGSNQYDFVINDEMDAQFNFYGLTVSSGTAKFAKLNKGTIQPGKAYLKLTKSTTARELNVIFADETTGINAVATETNVEGVYNMNGQRVNAPSKGLYIVNGKKVVIK